LCGVQSWHVVVGGFVWDGGSDFVCWWHLLGGGRVEYQLCVVNGGVGMAKKKQRNGYAEALRRIAVCLAQGTSTLDLHGLGLTRLPPEIGQLTALSELYLHRNQLRSLPPEIGQLTALSALFLNNNQLSSLPPEIGQLVALSELHLHNNQLSSLPPEIGQLTALSMLFLDNNQLSSLPPEIGQLTGLSALYLNNNQLSSLPKQLQQCINLQRLYLHDNPRLKLSAEVLGSRFDEGPDNAASAKSILDVYFGRMEAGARPLNEVKLLLVGRGNAGKTSTVRALLGLPFNDGEESTPGIALCDWVMNYGEKEPVTAHVWDFAGQVITHSLHQFFFSERSVYVLVLTGRENSENEDAEYWLRLIMAFGKDAQGNGPPVIVVLNKWDLPGCRPRVDQAALVERYPCIRVFIEMDCKTGTGIAKLQSCLHQEVDALQWVHELFPANWDKVRTALSPPENKRKHLSYAEFRAVCTEQGVADEGKQDSLAEILHNLGVALNYRNDPRLREATVLQPEWLTANVYALMRRAEANAGILTQADINEVLTDESNEKMRAYLMQLMERFEIAYGKGSEPGIWLVPQALPDQQHADAAALAATNDATRLRYRYEALPEGLLARAIVRLHEWIEVSDGTEKQWARGAILTRDGARALLRIAQDREVTLTVTGPTKARQELAGLCQAEMRDIHADIQGLNPVEETLVKGTWVDTADLAYDEQRHVKTQLRLPDRSTENIDPVEINNAFTTPLARSDQWKPSVFISYSKADHRQRKSLQTQLKILRNEGLLEKDWFDHMIVAGDEWHGTIQYELAQADVIVLLVSSAALATDYITEHEIPFALALQEQGKTAFIPIILEECRWTETALGKLNGLPTKGKALNKWRPSADGWKNVADGLAVVFKRLMKQGRPPRRR
jgi:internalin A